MATSKAAASTKRPKLTKKLVNRLSTTKRYGERVYCGALPAFGVKVFPSGRKSFFVDYGPRHARRRITIGQFGPMTVNQARSVALTTLGQTQTGGTDPLEEREQRRRAGTVGEWVTEYLERIEDRKRFGREDRRYLGELSSRYGSRKLADLTATDVQRRFDATKARGHTTANRWLASVRASL